jgi:hypothetical protein
VFDFNFDSHFLFFEYISIFDSLSKNEIVGTLPMLTTIS